jgi:hypothetical protein
MNLMLTIIFLCVAIGLLGPQPARGATLVVVMLAIVMAGLYYFQPYRFM